MESIVYNRVRYKVITLYLNEPKFRQLIRSKSRCVTYEYSAFWNFLLINNILKYDNVAVNYKLKRTGESIVTDVKRILFSNGKFTIVYGRILNKEA